MGIRWVTAFLDSPSPASPASEAFWAAATGSAGWSARRGPGGAFATLLPASGDAYVRVQVVGDGPPRVHLDLHTGDVPALASHARSLGAVRVFAEPGLVVLRSPAGLAFCVVAWDGESQRPAPVGVSLLDQVCLDLPAGGFDDEAGFWQALTGWPRRPSDLPQFDHLVRGDGLPLRLLLQRTGGTAAGMHLDFACADVPAETARHVGLGASVVRAVPHEWTTLRDPAGREYCLTYRWPG